MIKTVLLIGCGRMGSAMARKWRDNYDVFIYDPYADPLEGTTKIDAQEFSKLPSSLAVVLAVKPQKFHDIANSLAQLGKLNPLYISIMAGITIDGIATALKTTDRIIRAMPNTPASIGQGMTVAVSTSDMAQSVRDDASVLLSVTGKLAWLEDEALLDPVTALSGSGPAYFYRFTEALAQAGKDIGLPEDLAITLAKQTFIGAAALAETEDTPLGTLRENVTSPGGTTAAGLAQLDKNGKIDEIALACLKAARDRSLFLSKQS